MALSWQGYLHSYHSNACFGTRCCESLRLPALWKQHKINCDIFAHITGRLFHITQEGSVSFRGTASTLNRRSHAFCEAINETACKGMHVCVLCLCFCAAFIHLYLQAWSTPLPPHCMCVNDGFNVTVCLCMGAWCSNGGAYKGGLFAGHPTRQVSGCISTSLE